MSMDLIAENFMAHMMAERVPSLYAEKFKMQSQLSYYRATLRRIAEWDTSSPNAAAHMAMMAKGMLE